MENKRTWIILAAGVIALLAIFPGRRAMGPLVGLTDLRGSMDDVRDDEFSETATDGGRFVNASAKRNRFAGMVNKNSNLNSAMVAQNSDLPKPTQVPFERGSTDMSKADAKLKEDKAKADAKKKADDKKKADAKKKKRKKKKVSIDGAKTTVTLIDDDKEKFSDDPAPVVAGYVVTKQVAQANAKNSGGKSAKDDPKTLREWEVYILEKPDMNRLMQLVQAYQSGLANGDVFYSVVDAMNRDSRTEMRDLGVTALGAVPSKNSFVALVNVVGSEADVSKVRIRAQKMMADYGELGQVSLLQGVLAAPAENRLASLEAMKLVSAAVKNSFASVTAPGNGTPVSPVVPGVPSISGISANGFDQRAPSAQGSGFVSGFVSGTAPKATGNGNAGFGNNGAGLTPEQQQAQSQAKQAAQLALTKRIFQPFLAVLQNVLKSSAADAELKSLATQTYSALQVHYAVSPNPATPGAPVTPGLVGNF